MSFMVLQAPQSSKAQPSCYLLLRDTSSAVGVTSNIAAEEVSSALRGPEKQYGGGLIVYMILAPRVYMPTLLHLVSDQVPDFTTRYLGRNIFALHSPSSTLVPARSAMMFAIHFSYLQLLDRQGCCVCSFFSQLSISWTLARAFHRDT